MKKLLSTKLSSLRLGFVVLTGLVILSSYFMFSEYHNFIKTAEEGELSKLKGIALTLSTQISGDVHSQIIEEYLEQDAIKVTDQDLRYKNLHLTLKHVAQINDIKSDIYTLFYDPEIQHSNGRYDVRFGVTSGVTPYFRHSYDSYPDILIENFKEGALIKPYEDEHGTWLSAFAPINDSNGNVVAVVQVDEQFDSFISRANEDLLTNFLISFSIFIIVAVGLMLSVRSIIRVDNIKNEKLAQMFEQVQKQNKNINDSINYAKRIQDAIIPEENKIQMHLPESFILHKSKDIVSGDFPWFYKKGDLTYFAAVDCTGHGVPGAMLSLIGYMLLNKIIERKGICEPGEILTILHKEIVKTLKQDEEGSNAADGMDIALVAINHKKNEVQFAGAHRPLYHLNGQLTQYKGDKFPIGGIHHTDEREFHTHIFNYKEGDSVFYFSDGLPDQFGGPDAMKYGPKRIREMIVDHQNLDMKQLKTAFESDFEYWMGNEKQIDDVLLIGIRLNSQAA